MPVAVKSALSWETKRIALRDIDANSGQSRGMGLLPNMEALGYGLFEKKEADKDPIWTLLFSEKPEEVKAVVAMIEEQEPELVSLAASQQRTGQIQPIICHQSSDGKYDIIAGARRAFSRAFLYAKTGKEGYETIEAKVTADRLSVVDMKFLSYEENDERQDEGPIDKALTYNYFVKEGKMSPEDIGKRLQISGQTVRNYLKLLSPKLREYWPQINSGKLPVDRALKKLKGKDYDTGNGEGDSRHRLPNTKGIKSIYESDGKPEKMTQKEWELWILPDVRRFLAFKLGLRYSEYKPPEEAPPAAKVPTLKIKRERANKLLVALGKSNARTWSDDAVEQKLSAIPNVADDSVTVEEDPSLQKLLEKLRELYGKGGKVQIEKD